tara:strand:+ start:7 stop:216 length:210 start_codon:yes stop_codon:yes gene_type:complete
MNKDKILRGGFWLLGFVTLVFLSAILIYIGSKNMRYGSYTVFIIGLLLLPAVFYCAFKGFKLILSAIFE